MRANDRIILVALPLLALCAAFWFLLIAPKRNEASDLQAQIDSVKAATASAQQQVDVADAARADFPKTYGQLVELGRAVPADGDQATLVYDMSKLGDKNDLDFRSFDVVAGSGSAPPASPPPSPTTDSGAAQTDQQQAQSVDSSSGSSSSSSTSTATSSTVSPSATEATASTLPIGATIGPAGLPVTPYDFTYNGSFFDVADFLGDVDHTVTTKTGEPVVHGRLMTVDGFSLTADPFTGFPRVQANFAVTTYVVPSEQGLTAGATPAGPAPIASGSPSTVSTGGSTSTPTPTATATAP